MPTITIITVGKASRVSLVNRWKYNIGMENEQEQKNDST